MKPLFAPLTAAALSLVLTAHCSTADDLRSAPPQLSNLRIVDDATLRAAAPQLSNLDAADWRPIQLNRINLGISRGRQWIQVTIANPTDRTQTAILEASFPPLDRVALYLPDHGRFAERYVSGDSLAYNQRPVRGRNHAFPVRLGAGESTVALLAVDNRGSMIVSLRSSWAEEYYGDWASEDWLLCAYFGMLLIMIVYNFFLYLTLRDESYKYYVAYGLCIFAGAFVSHGYGDALLWPDGAPVYTGYLVLAPGFVGVASVCLFLRAFLGPSAGRRFRIFLKAFAVASCVCAALLLTPIPFAWMYVAMTAALFGLAIVMIVSSFYFWMRGAPSARYLFFSFFAMGSFMGALQLYNAGVLEARFWSYSWLSGGALELALLSLALADRINTLRREKERSVQDLEQMNRAYRDSRVLLEDARFQALQHRMDPHFLFNALNTIHSIAATDPARTADAVLTLSDLYRYLTGVSMQLLAPFSAEWDFLHNYLKLARMRFGLPETCVQIRLSGDASSLLVPPLFVQPVVENCFKHGLVGVQGEASIVIRARVWRDGAAVLVRDNGAGPGEFQAGETLPNIRERLELLYKSVRLSAASGGRKRPGARVFIAFFDFRDRHPGASPSPGPRVSAGPHSPG